MNPDVWRDKLTTCDSSAVGRGRTAVWRWSVRCCERLLHTLSATSSWKCQKRKEKWRQWVPQLLNRTPGDLEAFLTCSCSIPAAAALCVCAATARSSDTGEPLRPSPGQRNGLKGNHKKSIMRQFVTHKHPVRHECDQNSYLGETVICNNFKSGWDDRRLCCRKE